MHTISRVWFKWKFYDYCYYYFQSFHRVDCSSPDSSLYVDFLPLYIILSPISLYIWSHMAVIQKKTLSSILFFFFFLLSSTPFVHKKKPCGWSFSFSFSIIFFPSFLTLYKVETLLLQQKKIPCSLRSVFCHLGPTHSTFVIFLCFWNRKCSFVS